MSREILFRGMRVDTKEWVYGDLITLYSPKKTLHISCEGDNQNWCNTKFIEVIPETVGQFTGLTDKNGKKAFEGDTFNSTSLQHLIGQTSSQGTFWVPQLFHICFINSSFCGINKDKEICFLGHKFRGGSIIDIPSTIEIIGTIYDKETV